MLYFYVVIWYNFYILHYVGKAVLITRQKFVKEVKINELQKSDNKSPLEKGN